MDELEDAASAEERQAARRLAEALEGGDPAGADPEALAAARLLASLREIPRDVLAARRGAHRAVSEARAASRRRRSRRFLVPLAAALVLAAGLAGRRVRPIRVREDVLAEREVAARRALAALTSRDDDAREERARALLARLAGTRFETLRRERAAELAGLGGSTSAGTARAGGRT